MKGTHCKCNSFPEQVFKSVSKSLVRCISKNSCLLLILHVLNWERFPPAQVLRSLRCLGAECWELQLASSIYPFLISPNLLGGLPSISSWSRIQLPKASWELPWTLCTVWVHSYRALSLLFSTLHQTPGKLFLGQCYVQLFQSPGQEYGGDRFNTSQIFSDSPPSAWRLKSGEVFYPTSCHSFCCYWLVIPWLGESKIPHTFHFFYSNTSSM